MNKIAYIFAVAALSTFGSVATQAADGRDRTLYGPTATASLVEGRNAATVATSEAHNANRSTEINVQGVEPYIADAIRLNARSSR